MSKPGIILKIMGVMLISALLTTAGWIIPNNRLYTGSYNSYNYIVTIMKNPFKSSENEGRVTYFHITQNGKVVAGFNKEWTVIPDTWENLAATHEIIDRVKNAP